MSSFGTISETCLLINVGVIARGPRCLTVMNKLQTMKTSRLKLRLVAIAPIQKCASCYKYAGETGIEVFDDYRDLLSMEHLDLILELTGDEVILSNIIRRKRPALGVLDRHATMLLFDLAELYSHQDRRESEITMVRSFASALLEASPDGVLVIDRDYRIMDCNQSALIAGSNDNKDLIGKFCFDVMHLAPCQCDEHGTSCPADKAQKTGRPARTVHEITGPDDSTQIRQVTAYPIFDQFGEYAQFVITVRDMTKDLGDRIEQRTQALKKALGRVAQEDRLSSLGRLVASVCHEINNPITSIVTFTKLVRSMIQQGEMSSETVAKVEQYLDLSFREAMRCGSIVKHLLTFARAKSVEAKMIDIPELVTTVMLLMCHQLKMVDVVCEVNLPCSPFTAWGDFGQIQQCLLNLMFNAVDAMPNGGKITISGGHVADADHVWLAVSDTGHGIAANDLERIFEPFYSTKTDGRGVGLGLSMVYGIIREHHGIVEVDSEPDKGTTFRIELPRRPADDVEGEITAPACLWLNRGRTGRC